MLEGDMKIYIEDKDSKLDTVRKIKIKYKNLSIKKI
jgi:hypothetical protein